MKKAFKNRSLKAFKLSNGRCERIRTFDPLHPMQVRYQAAPHTDQACNYSLGHLLDRLRLQPKTLEFPAIHRAPAAIARG